MVKTSLTPNTILLTTLPKAYDNHGVAFVGSTMPVLFLERQILSGSIGKIYVSNERFTASYNYLVKKLNFDVEVCRVSTRAGFKGLIDYIKLLKTLKSEKKFIYIYHECCWPFLDLAILFTRPDGVFTPQTKIEFIFQPMSYPNQILKKLPLTKRFKHYVSTLLFRYLHATNDNLNGDLVVPVIRWYPKSILLMKDFYLTSAPVENDLDNNTELLILSGSDCASPKELTSLYYQIIDRAIQLGFNVTIKDHPNEENRLNLKRDGVENISHSIPCEILDDKFSIVIGIASAAMVRFGSRSVSLVNLLSTMSDNDKEQRSSYISSLNRSVKFPYSIDEIFNGHENQKL